MCAKSLQLCLTLCGTMDYSLPGSSVHGIPWARVQGWVAMPSSGDLPDPAIEPVSQGLNLHLLCLLHWQADSLPLAPSGKPITWNSIVKVFQNRIVSILFTHSEAKLHWCVRLFCSPMVCGLLCPWDFPGENTGVGCRFLLQGLFPTLHPLHWQVDSLPLGHQGSPQLP